MFIIGYNIELVPNWKELVDPPARSNMLPATYEAKLPELWAKKEASIRDDMTFNAHRITSFAVLDVANQSISTDPQGFLNTLSAGIDEAAGSPVFVFGSHPHRLIKKLMWDRARHNSRLATDPEYAGTHLPMDPRLWMDDTAGNKPQVVAIDLHRLSGADTHGIGFETWLAFFGTVITCPWNDVPAEKQTQIIEGAAGAMGFL